MTNELGSRVRASGVRLAHLWVAIDVVMALLVTLVLAAALVGQPMLGIQHRSPWIGFTIAIFLGLPLALRRRWPLAVWAVVVAASSMAVLTGVMSIPFLSVYYALYMVAALRTWWVSSLAMAGSLVVAAATLIAASVGHLFTHHDSALVAHIVSVCVPTAGSWLLGFVVRERRGYRAKALQQLTSQAVAEERLRIARELHDVVAHSLSLIAVKAAVANHVADQRPAEAGDALRTIEATSKAALRDMRRTLGVLRSEPEEPTAPAPGLGELDRLIASVEDAGVRVEVSASGLDDLPATVSLAGYRIVQEALTNVVKHAAPTRCRVTVEGRSGELRIEVVDSGRLGQPMGEPRQPGGHGLIGMRERVSLYNGRFVAEPTPDHGFRVFATLLWDPNEENA